jgi:hypothetical protein
MNPEQKSKEILLFTNGTYDLLTTTFRDTVQEDLVVPSLGYEYKEFTTDSDEVNVVNDFLTKIFPDENIRNTALDFFCSILSGGNGSIFMFQGSGSNGKTTIINLLQMTLRPLFAYLPTPYIVGRPRCIILPGLRFVRTLVIQDIKSSDILNSSLLNDLILTDKFYVRGLYDEGKKKQFKVIIECNQVLTTSSEEMLNLTGVIPFESVFTDSNVPETEEEQIEQRTFPIDINLPNELPSMVQPFMWLLLKRLMPA